MRTAVVFIIFNRPDTTARVFDEIARARPQTLLVIADGPRHGQPLDAEKCAAARAVIDRVDWKCEVLKDYSEANLGCGLRPATGLRWAFRQVEEAIILEDDCLPHPTFFRFCEELLERYRNDERVMHISGNNFLPDKRQSASYFFSRYCLSWGWASWRRAFQCFDWEMKLWSRLRDTSWLSDTLREPVAVEHWRAVFDRVLGQAAKDVWDFQWLFAIWARQGLAALPGVNLVSNIGFGKDATHTKGMEHRLANLPQREMLFPLVHPTDIASDPKTDQAVLEQIIGPRPGLYQLLRIRLAAACPSPVRKSLLALAASLVSIRSAGRDADHT